MRAKGTAAPDDLGLEPTAPANAKQAHADLIRSDILEVATREFAALGYAGARIDEIAAQTRTSKRMIYYHFGGKEGLYRAALLDCYSRIRAIESTLDLGARPPLEALAHLVRFTFDYQLNNADFIRLVMVENIHRAEHMSAIPELHGLNLGVIATLGEIVDRGVAQGLMRRDIDLIDLHMSISALCFFNVSNRYTFSILHEVDMAATRTTARRRETVVELILRSVAP